MLPDPSLRFSIRLPREHYARVDTCDYSDDPRFIGRRVDVRVNLTAVPVSCTGVEVAHHARCLAAHQTLTSPEQPDRSHERIEQTVTHIVADGSRYSNPSSLEQTGHDSVVSTSAPATVVLSSESGAPNVNSLR